MPQHPGTAKEELQRGWRRLGLPEAGMERRSGLYAQGAKTPPSLFLPSLPGAPYVREKIFLEASRWMRLEQQPPDNAVKS